MSQKLTRREFGLAAGCFTVAAGGLVGSGLEAFAAETVTHGIQIGALGALRTTLPEIGKKYGLDYEIKDFPDSTAVLLAVEQGGLVIGNTTVQHLVRAMSEAFPSSGSPDGAGDTTSSSRTRTSG